MVLIWRFSCSYLSLLSTVNDSIVAVTRECWQLLHVNFVFTLPSKWIVLIGRVDDVKLDRAAKSNAGANELYGASIWVKCWGSSWTRQVWIATSTADVVGVFQLKMTIWQKTASSHTYNWSLSSWLQVWNADKTKQQNMMYCNSSECKRSKKTLLLQKPTTRTHFADRAFRCTAPTVWNSLNSYTVDSSSLAVFKSRLKTFLFRRTFNPV